jgi:hypothetical protein
MTEATAITTVEELPAELRAELVAKREAGTTLAELKKAFPQVAPDVIRAVLPPLAQGHRAQARPAQATGHQARPDGRHGPRQGPCVGYQGWQGAAEAGHQQRRHRQGAAEAGRAGCEAARHRRALVAAHWRHPEALERQHAQGWRFEGAYALPQREGCRRRNRAAGQEVTTTTTNRQPAPRARAFAVEGGNHVNPHVFIRETVASHVSRWRSRTRRLLHA